jgi:dipeptidyl aminopeptidase/acylaminoacyl peptidase
VGRVFARGTAYDEKDQVSDLWIVSTDGNGKPRRLTFSKGGESGVTWSPDGADRFLRRREGDDASQIYILDIANGGEAVRVTSLSTGARSPQWRRTARRSLFVSTVYPGAADDDANKKIAAERKAQKYRVRVYDSFPFATGTVGSTTCTPTCLFKTSNPARKQRPARGTKLVNERGFAGRVSDSGEDLATRLDTGMATLSSSSPAPIARSRRVRADQTRRFSKYRPRGGVPTRLTTSDDTFSRPTFST